MDQNVDSFVNACRSKTAQTLPPETRFVNPDETTKVPAHEFLRHLDLNRPEINRALEGAYEAFNKSPEFRDEIYARIRFLAWKSLKKFTHLLPAYHALAQAPDVQNALGFRKGISSYETFRMLENERLTGCVLDHLLDAILVEEKRILPTLGQTQVEDSTPLQGMRAEEEADYNGHYKIPMMKDDKRWDPVHEALLTSVIRNGNAYDGDALDPQTRRLQNLGIRAQYLTIDGHYCTRLRDIATQWRRNEPLHFRPQEGWIICLDDSHADVNKRYQTHHNHPDFLPDAPFPAKLRFLIDHGTDHDIEAAGRYIRDEYLTNQYARDEASIRAERAHNEGLNAAYHRLPTKPTRRGVLNLVRRGWACTLTMVLVQWTRIRHGITRNLCQTASIV